MDLKDFIKCFTQIDDQICFDIVYKTKNNIELNSFEKSYLLYIYRFLKLKGFDFNDCKRFKS